MKGLYDIHCHILPGVDDGARNMEESLGCSARSIRRHTSCDPDTTFPVRYV